MYTYEKKRSDYGRQCRFHNVGPTILMNMMPDPILEDDWIQRNPVDKTTNETSKWSEHEANTIRIEYIDRGVSHREGGWPADINLDDPDQVSRFKRKAEKDKLYLQSVKTVAVLTEHFIRQNNAIDIFQPYFTDPKTKEFQTQTPSHQTMAILIDPCEPKRPVRNISWSSEHSTVLAVSYADMRFQMADPNNSPNAYVFDTEMFTLPHYMVESISPVSKIKFHHRDGQLIAGGLMNGQVALWDMRKSSKHFNISEIKNGHRDSILSLEWIQSKTNSEFLTGSSDGQIIWWDTRNLSEPTDVLVLDLLKTEADDDPEWIQWGRAHGVTCLDYNFSIPIRFMIGTSTGNVFDGNRKGRTTSEKLQFTYKCHAGPVYSVQRNPAYLKNFLTIGDWQVKIWSEEVKESPIIWTKHYDVRLTDCQWSNSKSSVFYVTRADGFMDCWDILQKQKDPILSIKLSDRRLNCITCHEEGSLLAVGDDLGKTHVIEMNDWFMTPGPYDKARLTAMFERETKREKIIEAKQRELRTKLGHKPTQKADDFLTKAELATEETEREIAELVEKLCTDSFNEMINENENDMEEAKTEEFITDE
ncbi:dynein intermediate chain 3, ciliary-like isoform X1 [Aphis craccivora]|uniref:Dynein intermediate chain 3, ciliary-like isoform X1 n=1 Tax=Aphis craccivora TaxID=307492 RepID=A0A6G0ZGN2_APHCR|nr:dynein intermediate chain 3, ciliary-like isoform X1 [Aphis craccivora]